MAIDFLHYSYCCDFDRGHMFCCITPSSTMNFTVVHGFSKIPITLDNISEYTVDDLAAQLEEKSGVPKETQKLIFKVKFIRNFECVHSVPFI